MKINFELETKQRLDQFLSNEIDSLSREKIKSCIKSGNTTINGTIAKKPSQLIDGIGTIEINFEKFENDLNESNDLTSWNEGEMPQIIFENDDYMIINKPSGLVVHPGVGNINFTLVNILLANKIKLSAKDTLRPGIVHRIDKNTSGILIIAKTDKFHQYISKEFEEGNIEKKYILISEGKYKNQRGTIQVPIGRDPLNRKLMKAQLNNAKMAISKFRVLESFKENEYVEFVILTGRTHQIRVHSKFIKAPVLNDPEYGKKIFDAEYGQYLHAKEVSFIDMDNKKVTYKAEVPFQFNNKLQELRANKIV